MKQRAAKWTFSLGVGLFLLSLAGCGAPRYTLTGNWKFAFASTTSPANTVTGTAALQQTGANITGTVTFVTNAFTCAPTGAVTGTVNGTAVAFTLQEGTQPQSVAGAANTTLTSIAGNYSGGCSSTDAGTWTATKV